VPILLVADVPNILVVNNDIPAKDLAEFERYAKANPGKLNFGSTGIGSSMHLAGELFMRETGAQMIHVPYNAPGTATTNLIAGEIQLMFQLIPGIAGQVKSGKVRAIAVMAPQRSPALPDVPTTAELGPASPALVDLVRAARAEGNAAGSDRAHERGRERDPRRPGGEEAPRRDGRQHARRHVAAARRAPRGREPRSGAAWCATRASARNDGSAASPMTSGLAALEARLADELAFLQLPAPRWTPAVERAGEPVADVAIVGAGMTGLALAAALVQRGLSVVAYDEAPAGLEGPWATTARMETLRSPKQLAGPALGIPSLTFRAWFEAQFGRDAWDALDKIPRLQWMDYLRWYRDVLALPVKNGHRITDLRPRDDGSVELGLEVDGRARRAWARRVVVATGRAGLGGPALPAFAEGLPRTRWAHSSDDNDYGRAGGPARRRRRRRRVGDGQRGDGARSRRGARPPAGAAPRPAAHQQGQGRRQPGLRRPATRSCPTPGNGASATTSARSRCRRRATARSASRPTRTRTSTSASRSRAWPSEAACCRCERRPGRSSSTS
jgi:hypothetical protein